jgi:hypothetical protein
MVGTVGFVGVGSGILAQVKKTCAVGWVLNVGF